MTEEYVASYIRTMVQFRVLVIISYLSSTFCLGPCHRQILIETATYSFIHWTRTLLAQCMNGLWIAAQWIRQLLIHSMILFWECRSIYWICMVLLNPSVHIHHEQVLFINDMPIRHFCRYVDMPILVIADIFTWDDFI